VHANAHAVTHTLNLDVCYGTEGLDVALADLVKGTNVAAAPTGVRAGGGWPEVKFTGSRADLTVVAARYAGGEPDDLDDLLSYIKVA